MELMVFQSHMPAMLHQILIYTSGWREAIETTCMEVPRSRTQDDSKHVGTNYTCACSGFESYFDHQ